MLKKGDVVAIVGQLGYYFQKMRVSKSGDYIPFSGRVFRPRYPHISELGSLGVVHFSHSAMTVVLCEIKELSLKEGSGWKKPFLRKRAFAPDDLVKIGTL